MMPFGVMLIIAALFFVFDAIYFQISGPLYNSMITEVQNSALAVRPVPALIAYAILGAGLYRFIIHENKTPMDAFLLGLLIYGCYGFTNLATLKRWRTSMVVIDTLWGGSLFALVTLIVGFIQKRN